MCLLLGQKKQSFGNKSGKAQPIQTKFGIRGQVKGRQRSGNFWCDRLILGKMGAGTSPAELQFFCVVIQTATSQRPIFTKFGHEMYFGVPSMNSKDIHFTEQATGHRMHCREILCTPRCSPRAREFPRSISFSLLHTVVELRGVKVARFQDFGLFSPYKTPKCVPSGDQPTAQGLQRRVITIFPCDSRRSKGVPSSSRVFLRLLVGELWTPNLPKFSPMANGYTHTECYYTAYRIWTIDV